MDTRRTFADPEADEDGSSRYGRSGGGEAGYGRSPAEEGGSESSFETDEAGPDGAEADTEAGDAESSLASDHARMSNVAAPSAGGPSEGNDDEAGDEAGAVEADSAEAGEESGFEEAVGWNPDDRFPRESGSEEGSLDAYFAEASASDEAEQQEFFGAIAAVLLPVIKPAATALLSQLVQSGSSALANLLKRRMQQAGAGRPRLPVPKRRETDATEAGGLSLEGFDAEAASRLMDQLETVFPDDDRRRITPTTRPAHWRRVCHLSITNAYGRRYVGTGFFIGPRTVATAGHCVYMPTNGGWVRGIEVAPGRDGDLRPYGTVRATRFCTVRGWAIGRKRSCDYGVIQLPKSFNNRSIGYFSIAAREDDKLRNKKVNVAGYPADKTIGELWYAGRILKAVKPYTIEYDISTYGGQSGSGVYVKEGGKRQVVAIHTNGGLRVNSATRITRPVFGNLQAWIKEGSS